MSGGKTARTPVKQALLSIEIEGWLGLPKNERAAFDCA
jgi:hypothetical protein